MDVNENTKWSFTPDLEAWSERELLECDDCDPSHSPSMVSLPGTVHETAADGSSNETKPGCLIIDEDQPVDEMIVHAFIGHLSSMSLMKACTTAWSDKKEDDVSTCKTLRMRDAVRKGDSFIVLASQDAFENDRGSHWPSA